MNVPREEAERVATAVLRDHGIDDSDASITADALVAADAAGKGTHGLMRLPRIVRGIEHGNVNPDGDVEFVAERGGVVALDGNARLGPPVAVKAMATATARADEYGIGAVGVRDATHVGMLGFYVDSARRDGYVSLAMTNTEPAMAPYRGTEAILGTNPIAIGIPGSPPFVLDMSTSGISRGAILRAKERGEPIPGDVALSPDGEPTTDPDEALAGTIRPFGGHKGAGLAIAVEVLAGELVGAAMGRDVTGTYDTTEPCTKGDLFFALDPTAFGRAEFTDRVSAFFETIVESEPVSGVERVRLPGQRSATRDPETITIDDHTWRRVVALAPDA